jgi:hypothetical protein
MKKVIYPCPKKDAEYEKNAIEYCKKYKIDRNQYEIHEHIHEGIPEESILWGTNYYQNILRNHE